MTHVLIASTKLHIPLLCPQIGQAKIGIVRRPKQGNRGHSLTDSPKPDLREMTNSEIVNDLPIQNLTIQEDKKEEELTEITDTLVPPPEVPVATPVMEETKQENIMED